MKIIKKTIIKYFTSDPEQKLKGKIFTQEKIEGNKYDLANLYTGHSTIEIDKTFRNFPQIMK